MQGTASRWHFTRSDVVKGNPVQTIIGKKFVWLHNPKTAGTAIIHYCVKYGIGERMYVPYGSVPQRPIGAHLTFREVQQFRPELPALSIAFVRHPIDRLRSYYNQLCKTAVIKDVESFITMMRQVPSQQEYVDGISDVLKYEETDIFKLLVGLAELEEVELPLKEIEIINSSDPDKYTLPDSAIEELRPCWEPDAKAFDYAC